MKVLLDTDIGSDIDDAVALAYLLAQPECDLLGITTVSGKPERRAAIASALCQAAGKAIPIFPGTGLPLTGPQRQPEAPQEAVLPNWPHESTFPRGEAIPFMRRIIRENPGEVTLLTIGPLTNAALLFAADEEIPHLLKGLVIMGGAFTPRSGNPWVEWNIRCDPTAAAIVYRNPVAVHRSVGLDVTTQVRMPADEVRRRFTAPLLKPVAAFAEVWFQNGHDLTYHDPLAAAALFDPGCCRFVPGRIDVELVSERLTGLTYWKPAEDGPHEMADQVDAARFFDHYFSVIDRFKSPAR
jgi:purine nucleosidase